MKMEADEELFGIAFYNSPVGICITTLDGRLQRVSQSLADMLGFTSAELVGKHFKDITHADDLQIGEDAMNRMLGGKIPSISFEKRYIHKSGEPIWALVSSSLLRDSSGKPIHFITHILNMTERKQAEEQIRAQAVRLKVLADASQTFATAVHDHQLMLEMVARQAAEAMDGFCGVRLLSRDGQWLEMVAMHDVDSEALEFARRLSNRSPLRADEPNFAQRILQSRQALLMPGVSEDQLRAVIKPEDWEHLKYIASHSRLLAPIRTRNVALGFLIISRKVGAPAFSEQDLKLAQDLADRAALAISNARLFQQLQNELAARKRTNQQLQYQAHLLENVNDAIVVADVNYVLQAWNQAAEKMYGWTASEVLGKNGVQILQTQFSAGNADETRRQVAEAGYFFGEATQSRKDGQRIAVEIATTVLRDEAGQNTAYLNVVRDITKRKAAEAELRESHERLKKVLEVETVGVMFWDLTTGCMIDANDTFLNLMGYSRRDVEARELTWQKLTPPEYMEASLAEIRKFQATGRVGPYEKEYFRKDGTRQWLIFAGSSLGSNVCVEFCVDISSRKQAEEQLRRSEENFSKAFSSSPTALMITRRADGKYLELNKAYTDIVGYERTELIGHLTTEFNIFINADQRKEIVSQLLAKGSLYNYEAQIQNKSGELRTVLASLELIQFNGEECILTTLVDITERKQAEERFRLAVESAPNAIILMNREGLIEMVNSQTEKFFGYDSAQLVGLDVERLVPVRFRGIHPEHRKSFLADPQIRPMGAGRDLHGVRQDGSEFPVEIGLTPLETSTGLLVMATVVDITERKQAEEQFYLAVESAPNAILLVNKDGTISLVNSQAEKFFGYGRADLIGLNIDRLVPERFRGTHAEYREGFLADPQVRSMGIGRDLYALRKDGSEFPVEIGLTPIETREGLLIMATVVDITERKRTEDVLRQSEERFASVFRSSPTPLALTRLADSKNMDVNDAFCKLFGFSREETVGHTSLELGIVDPEAQTKRVQRVQETGMIRGTEVSARDRNGKPLELLISIETIKLKDETYALTTMIDITERKQAEERNRFLANLVANVSDAIIAVDMQQNIQSWNKSAESLYGWKEQEVLGRSSKDILDTNFLGIMREAVTNQIMEQGSWSGEALQLHRDGTRIPVQSSVALYKDSEDRPAGIVAVNRDITERKRAEAALQAKNEEVRNMSQQLWQAAKLATMGELAASIAHELNNPLATVSLRTEMLQMQFTPGDAQSKSLQVIDSEIKRMSNLVGNLLQFSRRSSSQRSTINVNEEIANTLELIQYHLRKNSIRTIQELSPDIPLIQADRQQLRQVFLNLFTNSADAMPLGGILTIRTWSHEKPEAGITAPLQRSTGSTLGLPVSDIPQIFIDVSDTGEGIPPDRVERVWEPFYTTKPEGKGTGLGLAICRRIIQEHGGTIGIISDGIPGKGTTVWVSMPAMKAR